MKHWLLRLPRKQHNQEPLPLTFLWSPRADRAVLDCTGGSRLLDSKPPSSGTNRNTGTCPFLLWFRSQTRVGEGESVLIPGHRPGEEAGWAGREPATGIGPFVSTPPICGHLGRTSEEAWGLVSRAAACHLSLGALKAGQSLQEPRGVDQVRRRIAAGVTMETGRPGPRGARSLLRGAAGSRGQPCDSNEAAGSLGIWKICHAPPKPLNYPLSPTLSYF